MTSPDDFLLERQDELKRLGFEILKVDPGTLVMAKGSLFYWDYFFRSTDYTVFVKRVAVLSPQMMERDRKQFEDLTAELNSGRWLFRGLRGHRLLVTYIADTINTDAQRVFARRRDNWILSQSYFSAAIDLSNNIKIFEQSNWVAGKLYYAKVQYLLNRLLDPQNAPTKEPVSIWLGIVSLMLFPFTLFSFLWTLVQLPLMVFDLFSWLS